MLSNSNRNSKLTKKDKIRIANAFNKHFDNFSTLSLKELNSILEKGEYVETPSSYLKGKRQGKTIKLTGTIKKALLTAIQYKNEKTNLPPQQSES